MGCRPRAGLSSDDVVARRAKYGSNELMPPQRSSELSILVGQFKGTPVAMRAGSALRSIATGGIVDAAAILTVLAPNAAIGYVTESGAERTIAVVVATEIGKIQVLAGGVERPETPLQQQLRKLGTELAIGAACVCGGVFLAGALRGRSVLEIVQRWSA